MAKTEYSLREIANNIAKGTQSFVDESDTITVPFTSIVKRARIPNLANDLRVNMGIDRIMVTQIMELSSESGVNGERVYAVLNDKRGLIRFVGNYVTVVSGSGASAQTVAGNTQNYVEITFFGTGINIMAGLGGSGYDYRASLDGGAEGSNFVNTTGSPVQSGRGYGVNQVAQVAWAGGATSTTLGLHTIKIRFADGGTNQIFGFEIINAAISVNPGTAYIGSKKVSRTSNTLLSHLTGVTGTRGGRSVVYLNDDGSIGTAFQAVNASQANLNSADHSNEEVARVYNIREFTSGTSRTDDFGTAAASVGQRYFVLDDDTTTMVGNGVSVGNGTNPEGVYSGTAGAYFVLTFVGTGLDVLASNVSTNGHTTDVILDGSSIGTVNNAGNFVAYTQKIVSGLPYGTHTVKFLLNGNATFAGTKFIVYQPKKPSIPAGAIELADFNVMANYAIVGSSAYGTVSTGVLRKMPMREMYFTGTWTMDTFVQNSYESGIAPFTAVATGAYMEFVFYGTGFNFKSIGGTGGGAISWTVSVDGSTNLSAFTTGVVTSGSTTFTASTGTLSVPTSAAPYTCHVSGLSLGVHKVRIAKASGATNSYISAIDVITPVHSYKTNAYGFIQNASEVGSQSLSDTREISLIKEATPSEKAWGQAIGMQNNPSITSSSLVPVADLFLTIKTSGGPLEISYACSTSNNTVPQATRFQIYVDGVQVGTLKSFDQAVANVAQVVTDTVIVPIQAGAHTIGLYALVSGGIATFQNNYRTLTAKEL